MAARSQPPLPLLLAREDKVAPLPGQELMSVLWVTTCFEFGLGTQGKKKLK